MNSTPVPSVASEPDTVLEALAELGFSPYEAKLYVGLLRFGPQTGYALSKATGVPQPKVYETLRRLEAREGALKLAGNPVRYVAVPPDSLLGMIEDERARAVERARQGLQSLHPATQSTVVGTVTFQDRAAVVSAAQEALARATRRVYISARDIEFVALEAELRLAAGRGVDLVIVHFGALPETIPSAHAYGHLSTRGTIYRHHQARHLALVCDSEVGIWAVAPDGFDWNGMQVDEGWMAGVIKGFIKHDLYFQRVYNDFGDQMRERYGSSLAGLGDFYATEPTTHTEPIGVIAADEATG